MHNYFQISHIPNNLFDVRYNDRIVATKVDYDSAIEIVERRIDNHDVFIEQDSKQVYANITGREFLSILESNHQWIEKIN